MKFFTPELLEEFRSQDERIADRATVAWENRNADYDRHLSTIRSQLPKDFASLVQGYALHDAIVTNFGKTKNSSWTNSFGIFVWPHGSSEVMLFLLYKLKNEPRLTTYRSSTPAQTSPLEWLYDEVEVIETGVLFNLIHAATFRHSILLSSNQELQIDFTDFRLVSVKPMAKKSSSEIRLPRAPSHS